MEYQAGYSMYDLDEGLMCHQNQDSVCDQAQGSMCKLPYEPT